LLPVGVAVLEEFRESFRFIGTEPDYGTWLAPWLFERVAHVPHHGLGRRVRKPLKRSPSLPCRFQARSSVLGARDLLWITHRTSSPEGFVARQEWTGPSDERG
jgi:hypothetical protein